MNEERTVVFDEDLHIEAYRFNGIMQKFPNHFHEYYVLGFVANGRRKMLCKNREYMLETGDMVLLNPRDNHSCYQVDEYLLDWRCLNIKEDIIRKVTEEITGSPLLPVFTSHVIPNGETASRLNELHELILNRQKDFKKEEVFYFLIEELIHNYTAPAENTLNAVSNEIQQACTFMEEHYALPITLNDLCRISGLKKYTLLRHFTSQQGVTPYQYLETIRVSEAKKLLEKGLSPVDISLQTGFADQSHFTRFFKNYIGLTPKQYQDIFKK